MTQIIISNDDVLKECDGASDEDLSIFIPIRTLRRLVAESEALRFTIKEITNATWVTNPDRSGGAYSEEELRDANTWK